MSDQAWNRPRPWPEIVEAYRKTEDSIAPEERERAERFWQAHSAVVDLAAHIAEGPLGSVLFGWKSLEGLGIQQTDVDTHSTPFLRVRPLPNGAVEFRYVDTNVKSRQWTRTVPPEGVIGRFDAFLDQLHWMAR